MPRTHFARFVYLCLIALLAMSGCRQESTTTHEANSEPAAPAPAAAEESPSTQYAWYLEGRTPAGRTEIVRHGDGRISSESFVHWNNREWTVNSETRFDENGLPIAQRITGISPFQAPIDETFELADGLARWQSLGESGEASVSAPAFYLPAEFGPRETLPALIRAALATVNREIALLPLGTARVESWRTEQVDTGTGSATLTLYAVHGLGFMPTLVWLDENLELAAIDNSGYLGMLPEGWDPALLTQLGRIQLEENARYIEEIAADLAIPLPESVIIENVDVVNVVSGELESARHVRLSAGLIEQVSDQPIEDESALRIDASGKTLIPGMWDMHGHFSLEDGVLNIAGGITSVRDIGNVHEQIVEAAAKFASGEVIGPTTYRAGFMDRAGPYASGFAADSLEEALERVDFYADNGYLQVKLYSSIEPEWVAPIAERTHARGMRLSGHIPAFMSATQAIEAGYDEIQHINMVFLNFIVGDQGDTRQQIRFTEYGDHAADIDLDSDEVNAFIELMKEHNVVLDPTAAIFETMLIHQSGQPDPTFAAVIDHLPPTLRRPMYNPEMVLGPNWPESAKRQSEMLRKLHEAGIQLVPGSDNYAAFTIHRELEVYAEAGIPNADVLRMATLESAALVGADERVGSIEPGKAADLVLLDGNPLEDMSAVRRGVLVIKGNQAFQPDRLYPAVGVKPFLPSLQLQPALE